MAERFKITRRVTPPNESNHTQTNLSNFNQLDSAMNRYYISVGRIDYFDDDNNGKLSSFCNLNGIDLDDIADELKYDPLDCLLVDFDETFPFHSTHSIQTKNAKIMAKIMKKLIK